MDLLGLDFKSQAENTAEMHVTHPVTLEDMYDANGKPVTVTVMGMECAIAKRAIKARAQKQMNTRKTKVDIDEARAFSVGLLSKLIVASSGLTEGGVVLDLSDPETSNEVLTRFGWLREQIDEFVADRGNFYKA